jgi:hypothetical protein
MISASDNEPSIVTSGDLYDPSNSSSNSYNEKNLIT